MSAMYLSIYIIHSLKYAHEVQKVLSDEIQTAAISVQVEVQQFVLSMVDSLTTTKVSVNFQRCLQTYIHMYMYVHHVLHQRTVACAVRIT